MLRDTNCDSALALSLFTLTNDALTSDTALVALEPKDDGYICAQRIRPEDT